MEAQVHSNTDSLVICMLPFEQLNVYHESLKFVDDVYGEVKKWPREELFGLIDQVKRASVSIALNIAEGSSRTKKDFHHFLDLSRGSCYECIAVLMIAKNRSFLNEEQYYKLYESCSQIIRMINGLRKSLL